MQVDFRTYYPGFPSNTLNPPRETLTNSAEIAASLCPTIKKEACCCETVRVKKVQKKAVG